MHIYGQFNHSIKVAKVAELLQVKSGIVEQYVCEDCWFRSSFVFFVCFCVGFLPMACLFILWLP